VRLDHLLSKEHWPVRCPRARGCCPVQSRARIGIGAPVPGCRRVCGVVLEGGTLTRSAGWFVLSPVRRCSLAGVSCGTGWDGLVRFVGALLGPERTGDRFFSSGPLVLVPPGLCPGSGGEVRVGVWLLVENCTVDASIFEHLCSQSVGL
jgi:hypothetical protein